MGERTGEGGEGWEVITPTTCIYIKPVRLSQPKASCYGPEPHTREQSTFLHLPASAVL